jgi:Uma2 family endonuclease
MAIAEPQLSTSLRMSWDEFLEWGDEQTRAEWVDGEVLVMSPVSLLHMDVQQFLASLIRIFAESSDRGTVLGEPFLMRLPKQKRGRLPDVFFVSRENLGLLKSTYLDGAADIAVEIVSPETIQRDRVEKLHEYEEAGVREYWIIDIVNRSAEFYSLDRKGKYWPVAIDQNGIFHSAVLDGFRLDVNWFWHRPLPKVMEILKLWELV